jgi:Ni/Fe-hydrogenase subunit HybB-like protein
VGASGYAFPNDLHIGWSLMIVMYPYVTGLVAGAFIVSSLYHVFGRKEFKPIGRLALATSLCFLGVATAPLLNHLGHPLRGPNVVVTPNWSSAMAGFGFIYTLYLLIVLLEIWFVYRHDIILIARRSRGLRRWFYAALALGTYDISEEALAIDHKVVTVLAAIGIPGACLLHGYVGFLFGALKSNPWWSTPLMPIIFLFSAVVSGIAALQILYQAAMKFRGQRIDPACVAGLSRWLWLFMILTVTLESLEIMTLAYESSEKWMIIRPLLTTRLSVSFIGIQMIMGALIPFILLMIAVLMNRYLHDKVRNTLAIVASLLLLVQVFAMRWNVVIGGQIFSKSLRGFRDPYVPHLFEKEGVLAAVAIFVAPFIFLVIFNTILPLFPPRGTAANGGGGGENEAPKGAEGTVGA